MMCLAYPLRMVSIILQIGVRPNNAFKPNVLRYTNHTAG